MHLRTGNPSRASPVVLAALAVLALLSATALAESTPPPSFRLSVRDGLVSLKARGAELAAVLEDLSKKAGFALAFYERPDLPLFAEMEDVPVEDCLKKILPSYSLEYRRKAGGKPTLTRVAVFRVRPLERISTPSSGIAIAYGKGSNQLGAVSTPGVERQGPASFAVDDQGNLFVCDTVNGRIKAFSPEGKTILDIAAAGALVDLALDEAGNIFAFDGRSGALAAYDPTGKPISAIPIPPDLLPKAQNLRLVGGRIVLVGRDQEEFELGSLKEGELKKREKIAVSKGLAAESGKSYAALRASESLAELEIREGEETRRVGFPLPRLASVAFLGEDGSGNVYLQVEQSREKGPGVDLGVIKLDPEMNPVAMIEKIPNNYSNWTARLLQINRRGDVFQMLPNSDGVALNRWNWERKRER